MQALRDLKSQKVHFGVSSSPVKHCLPGPHPVGYNCGVPGQFRWPVLRRLSLAGFQVIPEAQPKCRTSMMHGERETRNLLILRKKRW